MERTFLLILCLIGALGLSSESTVLQSNPTNLQTLSSINEHPLFKALHNLDDAEDNKASNVVLTKDNPITSSADTKNAVLSTRDSITDGVLQVLTSLSSILIPLLIFLVTLAQAFVTPLVILFDYLADLSFIQYLEPLSTVILIVQTALNITSLTLSSLSEENIISINSIILSFLDSLFE